MLLKFLKTFPIQKDLINNNKIMINCKRKALVLKIVANLVTQEGNRSKGKKMHDHQVQILFSIVRSKKNLLENKKTFNKYFISKTEDLLQTMTMKKNWMLNMYMILKV
jgi:hypothetical protein